MFGVLTEQWVGASDEPECLSHYVHDSVHDCVRCESREKVMETEARDAVTESIRGGGVEIVGELLREAALTCLKVLLRVCTHNRSIYLNSTQATFTFGLKSDACRTFCKATPVWTVKSDLIRLWSHWNATGVSSALEEAGPGNIRMCCGRNKHGRASQWEEGEICFLLSTGCDFVRSDRTWMSLYYWFWCVVKKLQLSWSQNGSTMTVFSQAIAFFLFFFFK